MAGSNQPPRFPGATIAVGHLIPEDQWDRFKGGLTQQQAEDLYSTDLSKFIAIVQSSIKVKLSQNQFDALVSLAFNIGVPNFKKSSVVKLINNPTAKTHDKSLEEAWKAFHISQGKVNKGMENRRIDELKLFFGK